MKGELKMIHPFTGTELKNGGMAVASLNAEYANQGWNEEAFYLLKKYLKTHIGNFMCEHVRAFARENLLPEAPSSRAWGSIIVRAVKEGLIVQVGFSKVSNPRAHNANAAVWCATNQGWQS